MGLRVVRRRAGEAGARVAEALHGRLCRGNSGTGAAEEEGVERGAEPRGGGLVAARQAAPRLALGGRLPEPLL